MEKNLMPAHGVRTASEAACLARLSATGGPAYVGHGGRQAACSRQLQNQRSRPAGFCQIAALAAVSRGPGKSHGGS